jgi:dCTP deaminase
MVLSKREILTRMKGEIDRPGRLVITPLLYKDEDDVFDADSVDLRLGCHFLLPKALDQPFFSPDKTSINSLYVRAHIPLGHFLVVPAHQTILGATLEFIKLPNNVSGQVLTKSSVARTFIVVETAPWIHPEYRGCLTLEIANVSNTPVLLYPGRRTCQLILMSVGGPDDEQQSEAAVVHSVSAKSGTTYFGPVYPEGPKFKDPQDDLLDIGVTRVSTLRRSELRRQKGCWTDEACVQQESRRARRARLP